MSKRPKKQRAREEATRVVYLPKNETGFSDETVLALHELGAVLEPICRRLIAEGLISLVDGKIVTKERIIKA